jgi:hypothetical protein
VKVVVCGANGFPTASVKPDIVRVISVLSGNGACGTSTTLWLLLPKLIESGTAGVLPPVNWTVVPVTVSGLIGLLNTIRISALSPTFAEPFGGETERIVGSVVSTLAPVEKDSTGLPNGSAGNDRPFVACSAELIPTSTRLFAVKGVFGVIRTTVPPLSKLTVLGTTAKLQQVFGPSVFCTRLTVVVFTLAGFNG